MRNLLKSLAPGPILFLSSRRQFWRDYWVTGEWELRELKRYVDSRRNAIDVGGNNGTYTYHLNRLAKNVTVFEPNPLYAERVTSFGLPGVTVEAVALSRDAGHAELRIPHDAEGQEQLGMATIQAGVVDDRRLSRVVRTNIRTLDSYSLPDVGFIKIDVEGHEEGVLDGAMTTIASNRPTLLIEIEERHNAGGLERITARLEALGYDGYYFDRKERKPLAMFDAERHQVVDGTLDAGTHRRRAMAYINNFLFVPRTAS